MRGILCRGLRLELVAGLGIALAMPALALAAENSPAVATQTTLAAMTRDQGGHTQATLAVTVMGEDGLPGTGAVAIRDHGRQLETVTLNAEGKANVALDLPAGDHLLRAAYLGDGTYRTSVSASSPVHAQFTGAADFQVSVSNLQPLSTPANTLTAGQSGTATVTITPVDNATITTPMFVTISCSGLPDQAFCTFTPQIVEILPTTPASCTATTPAVCPPTSSMVIQTQAAGSASATPPSRPGKGSNPIAWAFLLPGALALAGLAWGGRRRRWVSRLSLVALVGLVTVLGATACGPRYYYLNHGPPTNIPTPAGTYTVSINAQTSNTVTAITHHVTMSLTVK